MKLLEQIDIVLTEMIIHGTNRGSGTTVVAFRKDIWLMDSEDEIPTRIWNEIKRATKMPGRTEEPYSAEAYDVAEVFEERPDVLVGEIVNGSLTIHARASFRLNPKSSLLARKVVKQLDLRGIFHQSSNPFDDGEEDYAPRSQVRGKVPDVMYHGTSAKYLLGILKKGLRPSEAPSNWSQQGISHSDLIFLDQDINNAINHANMTGHKTSSPGVVLELEIPNKAKLFPDYDVDVASGFSNYDHMAAAQHQRSVNSMRMMGKSSTVTKELGVWAYKGAILPMKISRVFISTAEVGEGGSSRRDFTEMDRRKAKKWAEFYDSYGDEAIYNTDDASLDRLEALAKLGSLGQFLNDQFDEDSVSLDGSTLTIEYGEFRSGEEIDLESEARKTVFQNCEFQDATLNDQGRKVEFSRCEFEDCTFYLEDMPDLEEDASDDEIEDFIKSSPFFSRFTRCTLRDCILETEGGDELEFSIKI